jgi:predicted anti-sigma-YlaC factor YlaD
MLAHDVQRLVRTALRRVARWGISCREFEDLIVDYLEGALTPRDERMARWHLRLCPECRSYLTAYRHTVELNRAALRETDGRETPEDLVQQILAAEREERRGN